MRRKRLLDVGFGLCAVGGAFFALGAAKDSVATVVQLPHTVYYVFLLGGGVLAVGGAAAAIVAFLVDRIAGAVVRVVYGHLEAKYVCSVAGVNDLAGIQALYAKYFGDEAPSLAVMQAWRARCASTFTLIHRVTEDAGLITRQELVGSYKLLPLTRSGVRAVELGQATGTTLKPEHISRQIRPSGYYLGDVVGTTRFARAIVIAHVNSAISTATRGEIAIYARPLTADGLRIMARHGFIQIADGRAAPEIGRVCKLELRGKAKATPPRRTTRVRLQPTRTTPINTLRPDSPALPLPERTAKM